MGSDSFQNLAKWKNPEVIVKNYPILVYRRPGFEVDNSIGARVTFLEAPLLEISATHIRELVQGGKSIRYLVPDVVEKEIIASGFYRKLPTKPPSH
jgi:nicotinate-nucleotide adenylyltransferase